MDLVDKNDKVLFIWDSSFDLESLKPQFEYLKTIQDVILNFESIHRISLASYAESTFSLIIIRSIEDLEIPLFASLLKLLQPSGRIAVPSKNSEQTLENLRLAGFINVVAQGTDIVAEKPKYEIGSASKLSFSRKDLVSERITKVWKLSDNDGDLINENDLLDESDKAKPNPTDLKVCGTTGKRKACKDCSCGLAEELSIESKQNIQSTNTSKSSCGNCYLGDAFRCASCPFLGTPASREPPKSNAVWKLSDNDLIDENNKPI